MGFQTFFLQAGTVVSGLDQATGTAAATDGQAKVSQSLIDIIAASGPLGIAIIIGQLVLSFIAVYIFVERYGAINKAARPDDHFMDLIRKYVQSGNIQNARVL